MAKHSRYMDPPRLAPPHLRPPVLRHVFTGWTQSDAPPQWSADDALAGELIMPSVYQVKGTANDWRTDAPLVKVRVTYEIVADTGTGAFWRRLAALVRGAWHLMEVRHEG